MGIPRLTSSLEPHAECSQLSGRVVLDGPAFAYHILYLCRRDCRTTGPLSEPSYAHLGEAALAWLRGIEECGITVSAIYFDGYLPASKRDVRLERVYSNSQTLNNYYLANSGGIPSLSFPNNSSHTLNPFQSFSATSYRRSRSNIPVPPLLVPAILEGLKKSSRYGHITHLVPGEADEFCANEVRQHGGVILTSDSDLLLYKLGAEGSVAFFKDIEFGRDSEKEVSESQDGKTEHAISSVSSLVFKPSRIMEKLSLNADAGMLTLGFEMQTDPYLPFSEIVKKARARHSSLKCPGDYATFASQYENPIEFIIPNYLAGLDPRISEFILQWTGDGAARNAEAADASGERRLEVFLPPLLERWDRTNAWEASVYARQVAYGLMMLQNQAKGSHSVTEYRRTQSKTAKGRQIELLEPTEIVEACKALSDSIEDVEGHEKSQDLKWVVLFMYGDILRGKEQETEALALGQWKLAARTNGQLDATSWDTVHFTAQIHGFLYSLRVLLQTLGFLEQATGALLSELQAKLRNQLASLPALSCYPSIRDISSLFKRLELSGGLCLLGEMTGLSAEIPFEKARKRKAKGKAGGQKKPKPAKQSHGTLSSRNPYDVLN